MDYENDIPTETALEAHRGTSFTPEKRAEQERAGYADTLRSDRENLMKHADTEEKRALLEELFAAYRTGYREKTLAHLRSRAGIMSSMITGPSNFPTRRMEKKNDTAHRRLEELIEYREKQLDKMRRAMHPEQAPIRSEDSDAVTKLKAKIAKLEAAQEQYKAINKAVRKHKKAGTEAQVAALMELGLSEATAHKTLEPDFAGRAGIPSYVLTNNNANIRRLKKRVPQVEALQEAKPSEEEGTEATFEDAPQDNRVRLYFPGKPDASVRSHLKRNGFRWAPSLGCWQAYRNARTIETARNAAGLEAASPAT